MTPGVAGLAALGVYVLALVGYRMARTPAGGLKHVDRSQSSTARVSVVSRVRAAVGRRFGPAVMRLLSPAYRRRLDHWLDASGRPGGQTVADVAAAKAADLATLLLFALLPWVVWRPALPLLVVYGWFRTDLLLRYRAKARQRLVERDLPDFLDVLGVTVQAGMKFRGALRRVAERVESPVSEEFRTALRQMDLGASRREAFEGVRDRNDSPSLSRFVGALLQAEELGSPLSDAMAAISKDMRKAFGQNVRKRAAEAAPKVSLVATILLMPGAALLLIGGLIVGGNIDFSGISGG